MIRALIIVLFCAGIAAAQEEPEALAQLVLTSVRSEAVGSGAWLRCGLPLAENSTVTAVESLRLTTSAGSPVDARIRVLTRRGGAPEDLRKAIDWIEVTFAPGMEDGRSFLVDVGRRPAGKLHLENREGSIAISQGDLVYLLDPKSSALLTSLRRAEDELLLAPAFAPMMTDETGKVVKPGPWSLVIEAEDPAAIDILASCRLGDLLFELRLQFASGCDEVVIDQRLVNEGPYGHMGSESAHRYFKSLDLSLPAPRGVAELADAAGLLAKPTSWALLQQQVTPFEKNKPAESFPAQLWAGGEIRATFERAEGLVAMSAPGTAIGYRFDDLWENAPKSLILDSQGFYCGLFPLGGSGPHFRGRYGRPPSEGEVDGRSLEAYRFEGARAKSHRIVMSLGKGDATAMRRKVATRHRAALHALVLPASIAGRRILGYNLVPVHGAKGEVATRFERFAEILVNDAMADHQDALGQIGLPAFIERGGTYGNRVFRGWFNHGDIAWGDGYSSLHYDLPFSMLFQYLRSGDARFLAIGEDMARHRRDIDQDHDCSSGFKLAGGQFYEKGYWHGNYYHPSVSHTWLRGPLLHWLLTGDRWSLEAALLNRDFLHRAQLGAWNGDWGSRIPGWGADQLIALWSALGDPRDLAAAEAALAAYERVETKRDGGQGYVINRQMKPKSCKPWMIAILGCAAAQHGLATGSERFLPLTRRVGAFLGGPALADPAADFPTVHRNWSPTFSDAAEHHLAWGPAAFFALKAQLEGEKGEADRDLARRLMASATIFHAEKRAAPIAFRMLAYPNSESKIHSAIQAWGLLALPALLAP